MKPKQSATLYPPLEEISPTAPPAGPELGDTQLFRLQEIRIVRKEIEDDLQKYQRCRRRYSSVFNRLNLASGILSFLNCVEATVGVGLLATGIGLPISIGLGAAAGASAVVSVLLDVINKRVIKKLEKHDAISSLAQAKLTSMNLIISKALEDSKVSDQEFVLIQRDFEEYKKLKHDIQLKNRNNTESFNTEEIKKKLLQEGKEIGRKEIVEEMKNLTEQK